MLGEETRNAVSEVVPQEVDARNKIGRFVTLGSSRVTRSSELNHCKALFLLLRVKEIWFQMRAVEIA